MEINTTQYETMTFIELVSECKLKGIKGYGQKGTTKQRLIQLLKGGIEYKDQSKKKRILD